MHKYFASRSSKLHSVITGMKLLGTWITSVCERPTSPPQSTKLSSALPMEKTMSMLCKISATKAVVMTVKMMVRSQKRLAMGAKFLW